MSATEEVAEEMRAGSRLRLNLAAHEEDEVSQDCVLEFNRNTDWNAFISSDLLCGFCCPEC